MTADPDSVRLDQILRVVRRRLWLVLLCAVVAAGAGVAIAHETHQRYSASVTVLLEPGANAGTASGAGADAQFAASLVRTRAVADRVRGALGGGRSAGALLGAISASSDTSGSLLTISAQDPDPASAARVANTFADGFIAQLAALRASSQLGVAHAQVIDPAITPPRRPDRRPLRYGLIGAGLGLLLGLSLAFAAEALDPRLRRLEELRTLVPAPQLAALPPSATRRRRSQRHLPPVLQSGRGAVDQLRSALLVFSGGGVTGRLLVAGPRDPDEGSAAVAASLAVSLARMGTRVCVVDADLAEGALVSEFALRADAPGLAEMGDGLPAGEGIQRFEIPPGAYGQGANGRGATDRARPGEPVVLHVVGPGGADRAPGLSLASDGARRVLDELERDHDLVVVALPPIFHASGEALALLEAGGAMILVVRHLHTPRRVAARAAEVAQMMRTRLLGVVVTHTPPGEIAADGYGPWMPGPATASSGHGT